MLRAVEHEHGVLPEDRLEDRIGLTGEQVRLVAREQLPDGIRVGNVDAGAETQIAHGEHIAVAPVPAAEDDQRAPRELSRGDRRWSPRSRRQGHRPTVLTAASPILSLYLWSRDEDPDPHEHERR